MKRKHILIVEDERIVAENIRMSLQRLGYEVTAIVLSGEEAIKKAEEIHPDLVLMDIVLEGKINGIEAAEKIRACFNIPIVYLTAYTEKNIIEQAKKTDPFGYIIKPFEDRELNSIIEIALYKHKMTNMLKESEEKYRRLVEDSIDGIAIVQGSRIKYVNPALLKIFGYKKEDEMVGHKFTAFVSPENSKLMEERILSRKEDEHMPGLYEFKGLHKYGTQFDAEISISNIIYEGREARQGIIRDITERKKAEKELLKSEAFNFALFQYNPIETIAVDREGRVIKSNLAKRKSGDRLPNIGDVMYKEYAGKHEVDIHAELMDCIRSGKKKSFPELKYGDKFLSISIAPFPEGAIITSQDITERKRAEEEKEKLQAQLIHSEKMAGIGTLASGIAHEFNNLLQIMGGYVEFAQKTKRQKDIEEALDIVIHNSDRAKKIIKDLLTFSRQEVSGKEQSDITEPIESVLSLTEEQLKKLNIEVVKEYRNTPPVRINKTEMQQVFLNMVMNARDAMFPEGGRLKIHVSQNEENVEVRFSDTGKGIEPENLDKIFEPFFTTKGTTGGESQLQGTGLGLSVSYGIVKKHGGIIKVESEAENGTSFTIMLPIKRESTEKSKEKKK